MKREAPALEAALAQLEAAQLRRARVTVRERALTGRTLTLADGRELIDFSSNDYLGLAGHPALARAMAESAARAGAGSGASHLITGHGAEHARLEEELAAFTQRERALLFSTGYMANLAVISALAGRGERVVLDRLCHASLIDGARLSGARLVRYAHADAGAAARLLQAEPCRTALLATDGVFSMDGDLAPVPELARCARAHDAWLLVDDAHGLGVVGDGRGSGFVGNTHIPLPLQMGTLSKAIGSYGGYLCASRPVVDLIRNRARTLIYSTGLPPACVAAAIAALDLIERDPDYAATPLRKAKMFTRRVGLAEAQSPIVPVIIGDEEATLAASRMLVEEGYFSAAIRPPSVPAGTARLRLTFTAKHSDQAIERLADIVRDKIMKR